MVTILNHAINFYNLGQNIASKVKRFPKNNYVSGVDYWTYEEFNQFINVIDDIIFRELKGYWVT